MHKAEALEDEEDQMRWLSERLASIRLGDSTGMIDEAKAIISKLSGWNLRWNITELDKFITQRQKELGLVK